MTGYYVCDVPGCRANTNRVNDSFCRRCQSMAKAIKSMHVCPECGGRRWWLCTWGLGEWVDPEANDPIVDLMAASSRMVDFCARCGCGVTSHYWQERPQRA